MYQDKKPYGFNRERREYRESREEREQNELLFGLRPVIEAIHAGKEIEKLFLQEGLHGPLSGELRQLIKEHNIVHQFVPIEKLDRITRKNHQGVVGFISPIQYQSIENIVPILFEQGKNPLILVLDRITDVRNFGAIARTAECAGVDAIVIPTKGAAQINPDAIKTSAGALHKIAVCRETNLKNTLDFLKDSGIQLVACTEKTDSKYFSIDYTPPTAIILGSEEDGISPEYLKKCDYKAMIPLMGEIGSLNVSVANGIILFEANRQRLK